MTAAARATTLQLECDGRIVSWPDTARDMFGRTAADAVGQPLASLVEPCQRSACDNVVAHLCRDATPGRVHTMDLLAQHASGSTFHVECSVWRSLDETAPGPPRFDVLVRNIGDRVRVEQDLRQQLRELRQFSVGQIQELRRTQSRFMDIAETIDEVFWMADPAVTRMLYISPGFERVWGRSCASLHEEPRSFIDAIHPDDREQVVEDLLVQRDGLPFDHEYRILKPDGTVRWIWDRGYPVRGADGSVDRYIGVAQDITARKATEAALRRQETIDAIGHMTGGLAHDFNNVLAVVVGHLDLINLELTEGSEARENLGLALDAALRGSRLAKRLLALARREPVERRLVGLAEAVQELQPLLQHAAGADTELAVRAMANPAVSVDFSELDAALINLSMNARAAMPDGGCLTITIDEVHLSGSAAEPALRPGRYASLVVDDTGCGMSDEVLNRLGEPYFTTRSTGDGTGLGLSMVYAFVRQSGGVMRVESRVGGGTRFCILLPTVEAAGASEPAGVERVAVAPQLRT